jgi:hypothetical protein
MLNQVARLIVFKHQEGFGSSQAEFTGSGCLPPCGSTNGHRRFAPRCAGRCPRPASPTRSHHAGDVLHFTPLTPSRPVAQTAFEIHSRSLASVLIFLLEPVP